LGRYENIEALFLVSLGAIIGVNARLYIYEKLGEQKFIRNDLRILFINSLASFLLGLFYSISTNQIYSDYIYKLTLVFSIGFFGSLSTFSTVIYDLFKLSFKYKFVRSIKLLILSISSGLFSLFLGLLLGNELFR
tara:strand:- start:97 stop:501 length:405 start_codon:yes stop_codon:yes gene_type:complete